jgi:hypothetical protein
MKKIFPKKERGAWMLVDKEFNIPLFAAEKQIYRCTNVEETISAPAGKTYTISFSEIKTLNYNVPERVEMALFVPEDGNGGMVNIHMVEVHPERGNLPLSNMITLKENINSLSKLKQIFYNMGKKI